MLQDVKGFNFTAGARVCECSSSDGNFYWRTEAPECHDIPGLLRPAVLVWQIIDRMNAAKAVRSDNTVLNVSIPNINCEHKTILSMLVRAFVRISSPELES